MEWGEAAARQIHGDQQRHTEAGKNGAETSFVSFVGFRENEKAPRELPPEAFHGIAGEVVRAFMPHTESSSAALLISFLVQMGTVIGRNPHLIIEGARHGTNLFAVLVGVTSSGRKGTAVKRISSLLSLLGGERESNDSDSNIGVARGRAHESLRVVRGIGSGEGLVHAVRDPRGKDEGILDKRALVLAEEFSALLKVASREGNTLSDKVREAWDNVTLETTTKNTSERATDPHIAILGNITDLELRRYLTTTEGGNGFANRFLWICTHRSQLLPRGGGSPPIAPFVFRLRQLIEIAQTRQKVEISEETWEIWDGIYETLSTRGPGLFGAVTSRAEAQVMRLALTYAVLDGFAVILPDHLLAALAIWDFCEASCRYLFGTQSGDRTADAIEESLMNVYPGSKTRSELYDQFSRNSKPGDIGRALTILEEQKKATSLLVPSEIGRPAQHWQLIPETYERNERSLGGNLAQARATYAKVLSEGAQ
jgi:hypothetical protein